MTKQIISITKISALALVLSFGVSYALAWTAPGSNPPAGNVAAPLNVSASAQTKAGALTLSGGLVLPAGAGVSKVLTSDSAGNATWQAPAVGAGDNLGNHTATQALNMAGQNIVSAGTITATDACSGTKCLSRLGGTAIYNQNGTLTTASGYIGYVQQPCVGGVFGKIACPPPTPVWYTNPFLGYLTN